MTGVCEFLQEISCWGAGRKESRAIGELRLENVGLPGWTSIRESGKRSQSPHRGCCLGTTGHSPSSFGSAVSGKVIQWDLGREGRSANWKVARKQGLNSRNKAELRFLKVADDSQEWVICS